MPRGLDKKDSELMGLCDITTSLGLLKKTSMKLYNTAIILEIDLCNFRRQDVCSWPQG